jgi:hypothetical protein
VPRFADAATPQLIKGPLTVGRKLDVGVQISCVAASMEEAADAPPHSNVVDEQGHCKRDDVGCSDLVGQPSDSRMTHHATTESHQDAEPTP